MKLGVKFLKKWIVPLSILILLVCIIVFNKSPWRIVIQDAGDGQVDIDIRSIGTLSLNFDENMNFAPLPFYEQDDIDIIIKDTISFHDSIYYPNDRLTRSDSPKFITKWSGFLPLTVKVYPLIHQKYSKSLQNDIKYFLWLIKNPKKWIKKTIYIRTEKVSLIPNANDFSRIIGNLSFGNEVKKIDTNGKWIKIQSKHPKLIGWVHECVVTNSKKQINKIKSMNYLAAELTRYQNKTNC